jgi:hypothetical protein
MLRTAPIRACIPASDVSRARKFYEQTIGLTPKDELAGGVIYECGGAEVFMYPTSNAGTSKASQAFWQVADVLLAIVIGWTRLLNARRVGPVKDPNQFPPCARELPRRLLKFSGGSIDDYATFSSFFTSPSC